MKIKTLSQWGITMAAFGLLTACGSSTTKIVETVTTQIQEDEQTVVQLQETLTQQTVFMESFDDLLKNAAKKYDKVEAVLPELQNEATELKTAFETAQKELGLTDSEGAKLEKLMTKAQKADDYKKVADLVSVYEIYETELTQLAGQNATLMTQYQTFLTEISADMPFQELETLIGVLNQSLEAVQQRYESYQNAATELRNVLEQL